MPKIFSLYFRIQSFIKFSVQISALYKVGYSLADTLDIIKADSVSNKIILEDISQLERYLQQGINMNFAFAKLFPELPYFKNFKIAIPDIFVFLEYYSNYLNLKLKVLKTSIQKLIYPFFLLCALLGFVVFFVFWGLPNIIAIIKDFGAVPYAFILTTQSIIEHIATYISIYFIGSLIISIASLYFFADKFSAFMAAILFPIRYSDIFFLYGICLKAGLTIKDINEQIIFAKKDFQSFQQRLKATGSFETSFDELNIPLFYKARLKQAVFSVYFADSLLQIAEQLQEQELLFLNKKLAIIPVILLLLVFVLILFYLFLMALPLNQIINSSF